MSKAEKAEKAARLAKQAGFCFSDGWWTYNGKQFAKTAVALLQDLADPGEQWPIEIMEQAQKIEFEPTQGGPREGAGRKPVEGTTMKSVKLTPEQWAKAERIGRSRTGRGNAAEGIRRALDAFLESP